MSHYSDLDTSVIDELPPGKNTGSHCRCGFREAQQCDRQSKGGLSSGAAGVLGLYADRRV